mgnify:CR=1 FL=1
MSSRVFNNNNNNINNKWNSLKEKKNKTTTMRIWLMETQKEIERERIFKEYGLKCEWVREMAKQTIGKQREHVWKQTRKKVCVPNC